MMIVYIFVTMVLNQEHMMTSLPLPLCVLVLNGRNGYQQTLG